ncbi:hypothetical protein BHUM_04679 [Candidatus Burkholderia humilis]|nr:hypothetical protein BHUM_04679 [Candidatus Burkholderia humilis]
MLRFSDRSILIGLCVIGLSIAVPSLLLRSSGHRAEEQSWSTHQRASVSTGAVREEAPSAPVAPESPPDVKQTENATDGEIATDLQSSASPDQVRALPPKAPQHARSVKKPRSSRAAAPVKEANDAAQAEGHGTQLTEERRAEATTNGVESSDREPEQVSQRAADTSHESSPPSSVNPPQSEVRTNSDTQEPVFAAMPRPKTRKDVQDELSKARMNGSLPRFGNPDPYGPGGSPSASN